MQNANNFEREFKEVGMIETFVKKPAKSLRRIKINLRVDYVKSTEITEAFNQGAGWKETKKIDLQGKLSNSVEDLDEIESAKLKIDLDSVLLDSSFNSNDVEFQGVEKINDRITYVITKLNKNQKQEKLYFDSITGQMIKMSVEDMDMYFDNFKKNGNLTMPYTIYYKHKFSNGAMSWMKLEVNEWKLNEEINDSMFEKPKTISPNV